MTQAQTRAQMHRHFTQSHVRTYRQVQSRPRFVLQDMGVVSQRDIYDWLEKDIPALTAKKNG